MDPDYFSQQLEYQLIYDPNDQSIMGFKLDLKNSRGFLDISLTDETIIFGENGLIAEPEDLVVLYRLKT